MLLELEMEGRAVGLQLGLGDGSAWVLEEVEPTFQGTEGGSELAALTDDFGYSSHSNESCRSSSLASSSAIYIYAWGHCRDMYQSCTIVNVLTWNVMLSS